MAFEQPVLERLSEADLDVLKHAFPPHDVLPKAFRRRSAMTTGELANEVTTLGWDTTYVLRVSDVNKVLEKSPDAPKTFEQTLDATCKIDGTWGAWKVAQGGSGSILFFAIPVKTGKMVLNGKTVEMADSIAYISLKLKYIPQKPKPPSTPAPTSVPTVSLAQNDIYEVDDLVRDAEDRSDADPAVVVQNLTFKNGAPPTYERYLMIGALQEWFNANLLQFTYIFAAVSINERAADQAFQWLKPTYTGYGYQDGLDDENSFFGILSMTDNRSPATLSNVIAPGSVPSKSRAGFNISLSRYMEKVIFPSLVKGFPHASPSSFTLNETNTMIVNKERIKCDDIKSGAIWYTPYIHDFVLQVIGSEIQVYTKTVTEISPGIRSVVTNTTYQTIRLIKKPDGSQTLDFAETQSPRTNSYIDKDTWVTVTEIIVSIAGAVAGAVAAGVIKGAVKIIIACVIIAIVFGLAAATPELIAKVAGGDAAAALPAIGLMILNSTAPTQWPGAKGVFKLDDVFLNGAFQLGGDPQIAA